MVLKSLDPIKASCIEKILNKMLAHCLGMRNKPLYASISYLLHLLKMYKVLIGRLPHEFLLLESAMLHVGYI